MSPDCCEVSDLFVRDVRVFYLETDGSGHEVTPTFTHATGLEGAEAVGIRRPASQSVR